MVERGCCARWFVFRTRANTHDDTAVPVNDDNHDPVTRTRVCVVCPRLVPGVLSLVSFPRVIAVRSLDRRSFDETRCALSTVARVVLCAPTIATRQQPVGRNGRSRLVGKQISRSGE